MRLLTVTVVTRMGDDGIGIEVDVNSEVDLADEAILSLAQVSLEKAIESFEGVDE